MWNVLFVAGHVGPPLACCMIKVVDVPDMGYFASDNKGEVCMMSFDHI